MPKYLNSLTTGRISCLYPILALKLADQPLQPVGRGAHQGQVINIHEVGDSAGPPAQLPPPVQLDIEDPNLLPQIKAAMDLLTNASVQEHLMRGPHHRGIRLLPSEVAVFEQPSSAWPVAKLQELDQVHLQGDLNSLNANATKIITSITEYYSASSAENRMRYALFVNRSLEAWQTAPHAKPHGNSRRHRTCSRPFTMLPMVGVRARHFVIDDRVLRGLLADLGQDTLTWASQAVHEPVDLPFIGRELTTTSDYSPATHIADPGVTQAIKAAHAQRDPATGQVLRQWEWELTKGQLKHDSGLTKAKQGTARWSAAIQPQLQQLAAATPAGTTLDALHAHILALKATWDPLWEEYLKPRWRRQQLGRASNALWNCATGRAWRPCPPFGKEYHQRYQLVNDRLPKVRQRLHRAAEYRRGIDGRARNNA
ncbi:hypothetical protein QJQ45_003782 [Haematococcus lacustris]|nr:hypothetical protein QJQ45_003782 [Haematococcus lacustris]